MTHTDEWAWLSDAIAFALKLHANQTRKGAGTPYIAHLLAVSSLVLEYGGSEEQAIAAVLHDAIEDQNYPELRRQIAQKFGNAVLRIVLACTDADVQPKPRWQDRKTSYIARLALAEPDELLVSCADKLHNARSILSDYRKVGLSIFDRFAAGQDGTLWYYRALAAAFLDRTRFNATQQFTWMVHELALTVRELDHAVAADPTREIRSAVTPDRERN